MSDTADKLNAFVRAREGSSVDAALQASGALPPPPPAENLPERRGLPQVKLPGDYLTISAFARELGRVASKNGVFRREMVPVTVNRESGAIEAMTPTRFRTYAEKIAVIGKTRVVRGGDEEQVLFVPKTMSREEAAAVLESDEFVWGQRKLTRVNSARLPVMRRDARIELLPEGWDEESGVFTQPGGPALDETMELKAAVKILQDYLAEFPWGDVVPDTEEARAAGTVGRSRSRAIAIAAMLGMAGIGLQTDGARRMNFVFKSNQPGSGKSLLAHLAITPACGLAKVSTVPDSAEEFRKELATVALGGSPYFFLDDLEGNLKNKTLNAFMTAPKWSGRIMGTQKEFEVLRTCVVFLTGNNLSISTDLARRALVCDLFAPQFDIQARKINRILDEHKLAQPEVRGELLSALWALIRAWDAAGRPFSGREFRGYEQWSRIFGGIVAFAGFGDPLAAAPDMMESVDTATADMQALVEALAARIPEAEIKAEYLFQDIVDVCVELDCFTARLEGKTMRDGDGGESWLELNPSSKSGFGKLLAARGGQEFMLKDGRVVIFGQRGRNRQKKYLVEVKR